MRNTKYFIDHEKKVRECGTCREILPFSAFSPNGEIPKSHCKKCRASRLSHRYKEQKFERWPHLYFKCVNEDCNNIWSKSRGKVCPWCKKAVE